MPRKGGRRRKTRTHAASGAGGDDEKVPKSFVFKMGKAPGCVINLVQDMRQVMLPYTAEKLREKRKNTIQDFVAVAAPLGVSHFVAFSHTDAGTNMKLVRLPRGPTLSFKVVGYTLMKHVHAIQKRPVDASLAFKTSPLVVLNNFNGTEDHVKLLNVTFQNMFPAIDVQTISLADCRRVVLFHYDKETGHVEFRQYVIRAMPLGLSKSVKTLVKSRIPNLGNVEDISDFVFGNTNTGMTSDSEVDDEAAHIVLPDKFRGRGNQKSEKSAVRLAEVGPRLTLKLVKVEKGVCDGDILYHAFVQKTPEEAAKIKARKDMENALKRKRREEQAANVAAKTEAKEAKKKAKADRKGVDVHTKRRLLQQYQNTEEVSDLEDAEYYRQAVGEEPDAYMFSDRKPSEKKTHPAGGKKFGGRGKPTGGKPSDTKPAHGKSGAQPKGKTFGQKGLPPKNGARAAFNKFKSRKK
ncbi:SWI4 1, Peter Pan-like protein suppressor [Achlya hypogyna]|uniref:SWI4 1, Peter Pan-like protein suppressor n=1 Tax=Achlya hypogyna TaxID=1202772 RepID=A0A1V9ZSR9_ACHHY|nr:SWI4 1, Peter Pan-like protein suppressor [Achlya hypogyna]